MELATAIVYYFKEVIGRFTVGSVFLSGNVDLFYGMAVFFLIISVKNKKPVFKKTFILAAPFFLYSLFQVLIIRDLNLLKLLVYIAKIYICIFLFVYVREYGRNFNYAKFIKYISAFFGASIIVSYLFPRSLLWRINDIHNLYDQNRLQLFYLEPSELGFQVSIVLLFLIVYVLYRKGKRQKIQYIICSVFCVVLLYLAKPFGSIIIVAGSIFLMVIIYIFETLDRKKLIKALSILGGGIIAAILILIVTRSGIYLRIVDTMRGKDPSNIYRINVTARVMIASIVNTMGIGVGFGNLNTESNIYIYQMYGLDKVLANSFMYFIAEGGVFAAILLLIFIYRLVKCVLKSKSVLKSGLLLFIIAYQIFGGYFTNSVNWIVYAIICSDFDFEKTIAEGNTKPAEQEDIHEQ